MSSLTRLLGAAGAGGSFSGSHRITGTFGTDDLLPGGAKIRGLNLVWSEAQWYHSGNAADDNWATGWRWWDEGWLIAQLDDAVDFGVNVVRIMGSALGIYRGYYSEATYLTEWATLIDLATARGLYMYPCFHAGNDPYDTEIPAATLQGYARNWTRSVGRTRRCIAIDIVNEDTDYAVTTDGQALASAIRGATDLPLTYSVVGGTKSQLGHADNDTVVSAINATVDFFDFHWYYNPTSTDIETYWWDGGRTKKIVIGEYGSPESAGASAQTARYEAVADAINHAGDSGRRPAGAFAWVSRDFGPSASIEKWGLSEANGTRRSWIVTPFETIPKT